MKLVITSSPLLTVGPNSFSCSPTEDVLPTSSVDVATLADCERERAAYAALVKETGRPAVIQAIKHPRDASRKISGFDAWANRRTLVNPDKAERRA